MRRARPARDAAPGEPARFTAAETGRPVEAIVYHATGNIIGVRAPGAFYRFLRGFGHPMVAAHRLFSEDTDPGQAARAWSNPGSPGSSTRRPDRNGELPCTQ